MNPIRIIGPFRQILPMTGLPPRGPVRETDLSVIDHACVAVQGERLAAVGDRKSLNEFYPEAREEPVDGECVLLPGFIDSHTHICWAGNRAGDFAMRLSGKTYQEIAEGGGGIWSTVEQTRAAGRESLTQGILMRAAHLLRGGVTTIEVKSGYGLNVADEKKMLLAIAEAGKTCAASLVPTCLAAHMRARDFPGSDSEYLDYLLRDLLPAVAEQGLASRIDIFVERNAFLPHDALDFLRRAAAMGFLLTVHADQFSTGGSETAIKAGACSADHLEASTDREIAALAASSVVATVLPGASLGLGMPFAPARKLLDAGCCLAIASDWNPGSAPMGELLTQASVLAAAEKLSMAETFAGLTCRAARALRLNDRGTLAAGMRADMQAYAVGDYREIIYNQGRLKPARVWAGGLETN